MRRDGGNTCNQKNVKNTPKSDSLDTSSTSSQNTEESELFTLRRAIMSRWATLSQILYYLFFNFICCEKIEDNLSYIPCNTLPILRYL